MFIPTPVSMPFGDGGRRPEAHLPGWKNMQRKKKEQEKKKERWIKKPKKTNK